MKKSQLRKVIREVITEILNEGPAEDKAAKDAELNAISKEIVALNSRKTAIATGKSTIPEGELDELANVGTLFQLAPDADLSTLTGQKLRIATAMQDTEGPITQKGIALALGYDKQNPINANFLNMVRDGIIVPAGVGMQAAPRFSQPQPTPGEEGDEEVGQQATDVEDLFMGGAGNPLSMYFDNKPNDDGSEDFNTDEEPTVGDIESDKPTSAAGSMSDEDYDAWMKWSDLNDRLSATKSNILKAKRGKKGGVAGDISDTSGSELPRLTTLKQSLEDRMNALVAKSKYLQKKIEKETGKAYEPIEMDDEEDTIDEAFNREYEMRKLQFYAGIRK